MPSSAWLGLIPALLLAIPLLHNPKAEMASKLFTNERLPTFQEWRERYGLLAIDTKELTYRRAVYLKNLAQILQHNLVESNSYKMGVNEFTAMTDQEFEESHLMKNKRISILETIDLAPAALGADIDWTAKGMVSPVKNQGNCGSCWAFSAVGTLESYSLFKGKALYFSEQQLVDCSAKYGNEGCNGGFNYQGLAYVKDHGIAYSSDYPYTAKTQACKIDGGAYKISSVGSAKGCTAVAQALASHPLGVSVDATNWSRYASGIFNNCKTNLNHDVLLVGMADTYWRIKNSWSTGWGEQGFIRLAPGNTCGICIDKSPWPV